MLDFRSVPKSIINPDVKFKDALDSDVPFSFLIFIKTIDVSYESSLYQKVYNDYLIEWNSVKGGGEAETRNEIIERYREFVKDVSINFTTPEEKKFLSNIDHNNPLDLDIIIPFYSRKLISIADYYNSKREETKFRVLNKKIQGTNNALGNVIRNELINFLENESYQEFNTNPEQFLNIKISVDELYDGYPLYFNQIPETDFYDKKDLDYGLDLFLKDNEDIKNDVFDDFGELREIDSLLDNKRKLTKKYIGSDFFFLSTGDTVTDFVSGIAFEADDPSLNFLNIDYPTTASTPNTDSLLTNREIGFFRPHKTSILLVDGDNSGFSINFDQLSPNTVYYFPDPKLRRGENNILVFINDDSKLKKGRTSGDAANEPSSKKEDSKYYGYISQIEYEKDKNLDKIFNSGYVHDSKKDNYGNTYALFKNEGSFVENVVNVEEIEENNYLILNGYKFYDDIYGEEFNFDYTVFDNIPNRGTTRSGISSNTSNFSELSLFNNIIGGDFSDDVFVFPNEFFPGFQTLEGFQILDGDTPLVDTISSDLSAFPTGGTFYYSNLIEGGIHTSTPLQRALLDPSFPSISADLTQTFIPDGVDTFSINGEKIKTPYPDIRDSFTKIHFDDTVFTPTIFDILSSSDNNLYERYDIGGGIYVKNSKTRKIVKIENALSYLSSGLSTDTYNNLISSVESFDIHNNTIFIDTDNELIVFKIDQDGGEFIDLKKQIFTHSKNNTPYQKISNRFRSGNVVYFITTESSGIVSGGDFKIIPTLWEYDTEKYTRKMITFGDVATVFSRFDYEKIEKPNLSYDEVADRYLLSMIIKDGDNNFSLLEFKYEINPAKSIKYTQYDQK